MPWIGDFPPGHVEAKVRNLVSGCHRKKKTDEKNGRGTTDDAAFQWRVNNFGMPSHETGFDRVIGALSGGLAETPEARISGELAGGGGMQPPRTNI